MPDVDYRAWLTKADAAARIGVTTKTIEQLRKDGKLEQAFWRRPTGGPRLAVYNPEDVDRIARERQPAPAPFVLPVGTPLPANGNGQHALAEQKKFPVGNKNVPGDDLVRAFLEGLVRAVSAPSTSQNSEKAFLTITEAAAMSGLSRAYLRRAIANGTLPAIRDRGWRIRRKDLEAF